MPVMLETTMTTLLMTTVMVVDDDVDDDNDDDDDDDDNGYFGCKIKNMITPFVVKTWLLHLCSHYLHNDDFQLSSYQRSSGV